MNPTKTIALTLALLSLAGCVDRHAQSVARDQAKELLQTELTVTVTKAKNGTVDEKQELIGSIVALEETALSVESPGRLASVLVRENARVAAGELVAVIDSGNLLPNARAAEAQIRAAQSRVRAAQRNSLLAPKRSLAQREAAAQEVAAARAALAELKNGSRIEDVRTAEATLRSSRAELAAADREWKRHQELARQGAIAESVLDDLATRREVARESVNAAELALEVLKRGARSEQIDQAKARLGQAEASLRAADSAYRLDRGLEEEVLLAEAELNAVLAQRDLATDSLRRTRLVAPFAGRVVGKPAVTGTTVQPGDPVVRLVGDRGYVFEAAIPQGLAASVPVGAGAMVEVDGLSRKFPSSVAEIAAMGDSGSRTLTLRIPVGQDEALRPGMFGRTTVKLRRVSGTEVPTAALIKSDDRAYVWVWNGSGAQRTEVTILHAGDRSTLVRGVPVGAQVIVQGASRLTGKEKLKLEKETGAWD